MNANAEFLTKKTSQSISFILVFCLLAFSFPAGASASTLDMQAKAACAAWTGEPIPCKGFDPASKAFVAGYCVSTTVCRAEVVTSISGQTILVGLGIVTAILGIVGAVIKLGAGTGSTGSNLNPYTSTNPYAQASCTGTRYISKTPTSDPCGVYIPTTPISTGTIDLTQPGGGTTTIDTNALTSASLSVNPTSGKAPLTVTFSATDTSPSCGHPAIMLSAGDGTNAVVAIPATTACMRTPVTFTYTYVTAGTYKATLTNQITKQVLQTVNVAVGTESGTGGAVSLSVIPTSGDAPLTVAFTVTDTTTACPRAGIDLSAGDGSNPVIAFRATDQCTKPAPVQFTYAYAKAGTYNATIINQGTRQVLQTVKVTVTGGTQPGADTTNATLSVVPSTGAAPLSVKFTITDISTSCPRSEIVLSAGDGSNPVTAFPATQQCIGIEPVQFTYKYAKAGTYNAAIANLNTQKILQTVVVTVLPPSSTATTTPGADMTSASLTAVPTSGTAPLNVKFTITDTSSACPRSEVALYAGDGSRSVTALPATVTCIGITPVSFDYAYRNAGRFQAEISNTNTRKVLQSVLITVAPGNVATTTPPLTVTAPTNPNNAVNVSSSLLNLTNGSVAGNAAASRPPVTVQSGTWGDIQVKATGVTITAGAHDKDGRAGIGGFYGYNAVTGVTPQNLARQMCSARPWGNSSATAVIPPSFYDSICTARGYKAGTAVPASGAGTGAATAAPKTPAPATAAKTAPKSSTATSTGPAPVIVPPKVYITAVPASVKIGSRTSIFWNAVGVKSCIETSPDGSFTSNTLHGAASTVALTGETVFSIVCIKPDGSQISNFVRVKIAI